MKKKVLKVHEDDNVVVALTNLSKGETVSLNGHVGIVRTLQDLAPLVFCAQYAADRGIDDVLFNCFAVIQTTHALRVQSILFIESRRIAVG